MKLDDIEGGVALASESGLTDADYVRERSEWIDAAFVGGIHADDATRRAALEMIDRGRDEFLYDDPVEFVSSEFGKIEGVVRGVNVRSSALGPLVEIARVVESFDGVVEINAHCRQEEMVRAGCGHALMRDLDRLVDWVSALDATGATVSVKTRARVVDDAELARAVEDAGADVIHVDCMDFPGVIDEVDSATDLFVIGNNGVRSRRDVHDYLDRGANMVSTARGGRDVGTLKRIAGGVRCTET